MLKWRGRWAILCLTIILTGCVGNVEVDDKGPKISGRIYNDEGNPFSGDVIVSLNDESTIFSNSEFVLRNFCNF